jgi:hypothetical protein
MPPKKADAAKKGAAKRAPRKRKAADPPEPESPVPEARPACPECVRLTNPKGWISAQCGRCGMPVFFSVLAERNAYVQLKAAHFAKHGKEDFGGVDYSPSFMGE